MILGLSLPGVPLTCASKGHQEHLYIQTQALAVLFSFLIARLFLRTHCVSNHSNFDHLLRQGYKRTIYFVRMKHSTGETRVASPPSLPAFAKSIVRLFYSLTPSGSYSRMFLAFAAF